MSKIKIPKNQQSWLVYEDKEHDIKYLVTSDMQRTKYHLYSVNKDNSLTKIRTSVKPTFKEVGNYE